MASTNLLSSDSAANSFATALDAAALAEPLLLQTDTHQWFLRPETHRIEKIDIPHALPPHVGAAITVDDRDSLIAYLNRFSDRRSIITADYDRGAIIGRIDWHGESDGVDTPATPAPRTHTVTLALRESEEFARWNKMQGETHSQAAFAQFLEENAEDIIHPDPTVMIELSRDLELYQSVNFASSTRLESGDRRLVYETETKTRGDMVIPREFTVQIPLWTGEPPIPIRCAFRHRIGGGALQLGFEWRRVEFLRMGHFRAIATAVAEDTGRPVFYGRT